MIKNINYNKNINCNENLQLNNTTPYFHTRKLPMYQNNRI